jgi:hypothetical protein
LTDNPFFVKLKQKGRDKLKNNVFKRNVDTIQWLKSAMVRAVKTVCQTMVASIGTTATIGAVDWKLVISTSLLAGILSVLTSISGIPEVSESEEV